jgi:hypothetical protein
MKTLILVGLVFIIPGCVSSSSRAIVGPDGSIAYRLTCHPDIAECWEEAGNRCGPSGYHVVDKSVHMGGIIVDLLPGPVPWYNVMVSCN